MIGVAAVLAALAVGTAGAALRAPLTRQLPPAGDGDIGSRRVRRVHPVVALVVIGAATALLLGPSPAVLLAATGGGAVIVRRRRAPEAARRAAADAMPDAIELLVVCLHAGLTPAQAIGEVAAWAPAPVRDAFVAVEQRLHRGAGIADAVEELAARCGRSAMPLVSAISTAMRDGLPLAPVLDRLTDEASAARRRNGEAAARRLPVRMTFPLVTCTLPSFVLLAIAPAVLGALSTVRGSAP